MFGRTACALSESGYCKVKGAEKLRPTTMRVKNMVKTTIRCSDCGKELYVSSRKAINNTVGDIMEMDVYINPCDCADIDLEAEPHDPWDDFPPE